MPFSFWFSSEADADVGDALSLVSNNLEDALNSRLAEHAFGEGVVEWALIFIVRSEDHPDYDEVFRYDKKPGVAEFRLKVDHARFKRATVESRIRLLVDVLLRSVREADGVVPESVDLDELEGAILKVASDQGWGTSKRGTKGRSS